MAEMLQKDKQLLQQEQQDWRRIRITLHSLNVKNLEEGMFENITYLRYK